jgi:hypothetical protein
MACLLRGVTAVALAVLAAAVFAPTVQAACSSPALRGVNMVVSCPAVASEQLFVLPAGVGAVRVIAVGGKGDRGGAGAVASAELRVTAGSALYVLVGGEGRPGQFLSGLAGPGGFNGGGSGGTGAGQGGGFGAGIFPSGGGGGGGASDLRSCSIHSPSCDTLASRLIVAAGGGATGGGSVINDFSTTGGGGAGGTLGSGGDGMASLGPAPGTGGAGATATAGGRGGSTSAAPGTSGTGGRGADAVPGRFGSPLGSGGAGGGGGGGLFGGGGGGAGGDDATAGAGGGGGSSFGPPGTTFAHASLRRSPGSVTIAWAATPPAVGVRRPRAGQVLHRFIGRAKTRKRRQLVISGHAFDPDGLQGAALTLERLPRKPTGAGRCTWLHPTRGLRRSSCNRPPPLIATLRPTGSWTYRLSKRIKLPAGRYRVSAYGKDTPGLFGNSAPRRARIVTFRLSQR